MLLLIDIFSINRSRGYENPRLEIILIDLYLNRGFPLEEAHEHCSQNQSVIYVVILISFQCYCGDCSGYIIIILQFRAFYFCSAYFLYLVYYIRYGPLDPGEHVVEICVFRRKITSEGNKWGESKIVEAQINEVRLSHRSEEDMHQQITEFGEERKDKMDCVRQFGVRRIWIQVY
jgi:hypothetical protein